MKLNASNKKHTPALLLAALVTVSSAYAGTLSLPQLITSDATSGIVSTNTYTHAVNMGGDAVTINGVSFSAGPENGPDYSTTNFTPTIGSDGPVYVFPNPTDDVATMLQSFRFGDPAPQTLTIDTTGLTVGDMYDARIYYRTWDTGDRSINITFDEDGAGPLAQTIDVDQDATMGAWYLSYQFTATSDPLLVSFAAAPGNGGASFHLSGFSVQEAIPEPSSALLGGLGLLALLRRRR